MKETKIKVLMVEPGKNPRETELENNLDALQNAVSIGASSQGFIEIIPMDDGKALLLCNEEGKLIGLEGNRRVGRDIIAGVFYITADNEDGELVSLQDELMEEYKQRFWEPEHFTDSEVERAISMRFFSL